MANKKLTWEESWGKVDWNTVTAKDIKNLVNKGADANRALWKLLSELVTTKQKRNFKLAEMLLDCCADINQKELGHTLLHLLVFYAEREIQRRREKGHYYSLEFKNTCVAGIDFLLKHGANTKIKDWDGQIPSGLTTDPEIQKMLEAYEQRSNRGLKDFLATKASKLDKVSEKAKETLKKKGLTGKALHDAAQKERLKVSKAILKQRQTTK